MKYFILSLLLIQSVFAAKVGTMEGQFKAYSCKKEINQLIKDWNAQGAWKGQLGQDGSMMLKRPTGKFAHWMILEKNSKVEMASLMGPMNVQKIIFDKACKSQMVVYDHKQYSNPEGVNDQKLLDKMVTTRNGIIALWSPGMGHSTTALQRLSKIAEAKKLGLIIVMDPFASEKSAIKELKTNKIKFDKIEKLSSLELTMRDAMMHYPNFFVYKNGLIVSNVLPGLMTEEIYTKKINQYLGL